MSMINCHWWWYGTDIWRKNQTTPWRKRIESNGAGQGSANDTAEDFLHWVRQVRTQHGGYPFAVQILSCVRRLSSGISEVPALSQAPWSVNKILFQQSCPGLCCPYKPGQFAVWGSFCLLYDFKARFGRWPAFFWPFRYILRRNRQKKTDCFSQKDMVV